MGFWLADQLAAHMGVRFATEAKLKGEACRGTLAGQPVWLVKPSTFMNRSGQCARSVLDYYHVPVEQLLVLHDELDLPVGTARLKRGGGHGGHNGLRDLVATVGADFLRLRLGIGHPGHKDLVTGYVLHPPGQDERSQILDAAAEALRAIEVLVSQGLEKAMQQLHSATPRTDATGEFGPAG